MKNMQRFLVFCTLFVVAINPALRAQEENEEHKMKSDKLVVVWTSGDIEVAEKMVFMYVYNARKAGWFDEVSFIVWGPSAKLLVENERLQVEVKKMIEAGIKVEACIACARMYGVENDLKELGIDVKGMGVPLSDYLKNDYKVLTF